MKKIIRCFLPLVLPMLLSLGPVAVLNFWENWQTELRANRQKENWKEKILERINEFQAGFSIDRQFLNMFTRLRKEIGENFPEKSKPVIDGARLISAIEKTIPLSHRPEGSRIFGFSLEGPGNPRMFSGREFSQVKGRLVIRLLDDLVAGFGDNLSAKNSFNRRSRQMFGDLVDFDLLAFQEGGKAVRAVWEGERVILLWDRIAHRDILLGGVLMLIPEDKVSGVISLEYALRNSLWKEDCDLFPMLLPIEIATGSLSPIVLDESGNPEILSMVKNRLETHKSYGKIIPLDEIAEAFSGYWAFRTTVSINLPYEIWCFGAIPVGSIRTVSLAALSGLLWAISWIMAFHQIAKRGKPLKVSMRDWFAGFILLVGGIPVSILFVVGSFMIENSSERMMNEKIRNATKLLEEVDKDSVAELSRFAEICKKTEHSSEFLALLKSDSLDVKHPLVVDCFNKFRNEGIPLESLIVFEYGMRTLFLTQDPALKNKADPVLGFYFPMMMGSLKYLDRASFNQIEKTLSEKERGILEVYTSVMNTGLFHNFTNLRQKGFLFDFYHSQLFQFFDFIAREGILRYGIIFRAKAGEIYLPYVKRYLSDYSNFVGGSQKHSRQVPAEEGSFFAFAWETSSGLNFEEFRGKENVNPWKSGKMKEFLLDSLSIGVEKIHRENSLIYVSYPCKKMKRMVLGSIVDLSPLFTQTQKFRDLLKFFTGAIVCLLLLVGFGGAGYFLTPLIAVEKGFRSLLGGNLETRLNLSRDDELGDVATAFDSMMNGLKERHTLGKFVSQTLESTLQKSERIQMEPVLRPGTVLASDIRSFTTLSERFPPEMVVEMLNRHLDILSGAIKQNGGMIDKFIGDAIVAVFLDPEPAVSARKAVQAAREMMARHKQIDQERKSQGLFSYGMGVGIDCGEVLVGTFGSEDRYEFTVLGEPRLSSEEFEAKSKKGIFSRIIVSGEIVRLCTNDRFHAMANEKAYELID